MSDGTSLDELEKGDIPNAADAARMAEIMRDIDNTGGGGPPPTLRVGQPQMPPQMAQMPPQMPMDRLPPPIQARQGYEPIHEERSVPYYPQIQHQAKRNMWGSITNVIREPMIVAILMFVLSLPVLHTYGSKFVPWAFAVGGQLSWLGLGFLSVLAGSLFGVIRTGLSIAGV